jgi:hypothetical protein
METGLFEIQAEHLREFRGSRRLDPSQYKLVYEMFGHGDPKPVTIGFLQAAYFQEICKD